MPLLQKFVCFQMPKKGFRPVVFEYLSEKLPLSHKVLYYQQLSMGCYQVCFYANNYIE